MFTNYLSEPDTNSMPIARNIRTLKSSVESGSAVDCTVPQMKPASMQTSTVQQISSVKVVRTSVWKDCVVGFGLVHRE